MNAPDLLRVRDLTVDFYTPAGTLRAVDGLSFRLRPGASVALVGESGSGKSVTAQAIMGILPRVARITGGEILFDRSRAPPAKPSISPASIRTTAYRAIRGRRISMIFQEPMTSLSPLHTVGDQVSEALACTPTSAARKCAGRRSRC